MPKRTDIKKVLVIGSGPIVIGQAAEFDYAGTQACLALREEGYEVVLANSNPATIMTDTTIADKVYMEPLTLEYLARICRYERPDAIVPGIGGQTGLNLAMQLAKKGVLKECEIELLGTDAESIERAVHTELHVQTVIGIGTTANHLRELADRYKEAQVAIEVGKVFENEKPVIHYDNLGISRIIYQLPTTLCEMFLQEVFKKNPIDALDKETLFTINKFFENNLILSETARKLFVHRNTLVYRLEKIKKLTGLDLREFDDAITFKVALMVKKYLASRGIEA